MRWSATGHAARRGGKTLHETLTRTRLESRAKYADQPTRRLDKLGAIVFGDTVRFDVDDDLNVVSSYRRRRHRSPRRPFPAAPRSNWACSRLACATLVDQADGVPVIIDDALGYSDPDRIVAMASVLTEAARDAQVIVLTCSPTATPTSTTPTSSPSELPAQHLHTCRTKAEVRARFECKCLLTIGFGEEVSVRYSDSRPMSPLAQGIERLPPEQKVAGSGISAGAQ